VFGQCFCSEECLPGFFMTLGARLESYFCLTKKRKAITTVKLNALSHKLFRTAD
jgi:hypothetical protein